MGGFPSCSDNKNVGGGIHGQEGGEDEPGGTQKVFHSLVVCHKLCAAIRYISERDKGRVYYPQDTDDKSGDLFINVLKGKNPQQQDTPITNFF